ncbi:MAG: hypothetical protein ABI430_00685 [Candidatus Taylorbacteria bacterium]
MNTLTLATLARKKKQDRSILIKMVGRWNEKNFHYVFGDPIFCALELRPILLATFLIPIFGWIVGGVFLYPFPIAIILVGFLSTTLGLLLAPLTAWLDGRHHPFQHHIWMWQRVQKFCRSISLLEQKAGTFNLDWSTEKIANTATAILKDKAREVKTAEQKLAEFIKTHENDLTWERPYSKPKESELRDAEKAKRDEFKRLYHKWMFPIADISENHAMFFEDMPQVVRA